MFARPGDWTPEALEAARAELRTRNLPVPDAAPPEPWTKQHVMEVAKYQKAIIWILLVTLAASFIHYATLVTGILQLRFMYRLAVALRLSPWGYVIMPFIPFLGVIALLHLNGRATRRLRESGVQVALMGARKEDLDKLAA